LFVVIFTQRQNGVIRTALLSTRSFASLLKRTYPQSFSKSAADTTGFLFAQEGLY
jgi:hypothetical protein